MHPCKTDYNYFHKTKILKHVDFHKTILMSRGRIILCWNNIGEILKLFWWWCLFWSHRSVISLFIGFMVCLCTNSFCFAGTTQEMMLTELGQLVSVWGLGVSGGTAAGFHCGHCAPNNNAFSYTSIYRLT